MEERKNSKKRLAIIALLAVTTISASYISGTFAKYTSTANGSDTARVAKWDVKINSDEFKKFTTISLFDSAYAGLEDATKDTVESLDGENVVAPGTSGEFTFDISNDSEVATSYNIVLTEANSQNIPIEYSIDKTNYAKASSGTINLGTLATGKISPDAGTTVTIYWRWAFEDSTAVATRDAADTALGEAEDAAEVQVTAEITATQID